MNFKKSSIFIYILAALLIFVTVTFSLQNHQLKKEKLALDRLSVTSPIHLFTEINYINELQEKIVDTQDQAALPELLVAHKYLLQGYMYHADSVALAVGHQDEVSEEYRILDYSLREAFIRFDEANSQEARSTAFIEIEGAITDFKVFVDSLYEKLEIQPEVI